MLACSLFFSLASLSTPNPGCWLEGLTSQDTSFCDQHTAFSLLHPILCCASVVQWCWKSRLVTSPPCMMNSAMHQRPAALLWSKKILRCLGKTCGPDPGLLRGSVAQPGSGDEHQMGVKRTCASSDSDQIILPCPSNSKTKTEEN